MKQKRRLNSKAELPGQNKTVSKPLCLDMFVCLFVLMLNVQVNNFPVMSGRSQRFLGLSSIVGSQSVLLTDTTRSALTVFTRYTTIYESDQPYRILSAILNSGHLENYKLMSKKYSIFKSIGLRCFLSTSS